MKHLLTVSVLLYASSLFAISENIFIVTNPDGTISGKKIRHKKNHFFDDVSLPKEQDSLREQEGGSYDKSHLIANAKAHLGGKYVWGGTQPSGFDCSGYMQYLYQKEGIALPRTAYEQSKVGASIRRDALQKGDLLFFLTDRRRNLPITHVGMYIGNDYFIHAASKREGIIISSLSKSKYAKLYVKAKRIIQ